MKKSKKSETFANAAPNTLFLSSSALPDEHGGVLRLSDTPHINDLSYSDATAQRGRHPVRGRVLWHHLTWGRGFWSGSCRAGSVSASWALATVVNAGLHGVAKWAK